MKKEDYQVLRELLKEFREEILQPLFFIDGRLRRG